MEQRIDTQKVTPVDAAGADPASVPGLTPPRQAPETEEKALSLEKTDPTEPSEPAEELDAEPEPEPEPEPAEDVADAPADAPSADTAGPDFTASDRRGSITADATGVRLQLDDQEAEFHWDEIGAVEVGTSRRRLTVTVHTPDSRWYPNDVEAPNKARAQEWADELDRVLDAYFED
ncbi:hypothetical protein ACFVY1_24725 [Streptomyces sp. NPDC058293]|uniref:Uncharacterized protein n=1 Tax=Streptomyces sp. NBC_00119 TaxID=2975659 RepID=A0AAU1UA67_9ACTN|nr:MULTISPECIES: hypothetical protein [unclassified Streptomyces]MCX4643487.1 hypothetical protein [Streptomyces sp. NBC_01446]MCX5324610.1 hypothetical protein [Streptomyces sp. NBC_00120]